MPTPSPHDKLKASPPLMNEADIGSGEKSPGQHETEEMIRQIPPLPSDKDREARKDEDSDGDGEPPISSPS